MKNTIMMSAAMGVASLLIANMLQFGYKVTGFYPPTQVFYFAIGASVYALFDIFGFDEKYVKHKMIQA